MRVEGQLGSIDLLAVDGAFNQQMPALQRCHVARLKQLRALGGDVKVMLRVGEDGRVRYAYLEETSLGDSVTEQCLVRVLSEATWPKPTAGEAEVRKFFGFEAPSNVRRPVSWTPEDLKDALSASESRIRTCRGKVTGAFNATAYIAPGPPAEPPPTKVKGGHKKPAKRVKRNAKPSGHIVAVGMSLPSHEGADVVECLVEALKETRMPNPGPRGAKVSFSL